MRQKLTTAARHFLGHRPRRVATVIGAYGPRRLRARVLNRLGVRNRGHIGFGVRFTNSAVDIGAGARIGRGCRFLGGGSIVLRDGVVLPPGTVITTRQSLSHPDVTYDRPVMIRRSPS